ncbi:hypothetical protein J4G65_21385 [Aeromonas allosaccharophila]|uniref:hypothetical protein n=1 Tax=Aeromonas allosaccharophila TaxID=656 RepID=UPI001BD06530|nr:hypothetical protein [Aeromonas allosaccharophila]MBS4697998.1 hypothetical protein [Aeromonas allosaccharophila]
MILYDPHCDDNIFTPVSYYIGRRTALKKYEYIKSAMVNNGGLKIYFSYKNSSLPNVIIKKIPNIFLRWIVLAEIFIWRYINNIDSSCVINEIDGHDVFCFGYKKFNNITHDEVNSSKTFNIHLTHYHTYGYNSIYLEPNVNLLYDTDVSHHLYFMSKFIGYTRKVIVMPFYVKDRFFTVPLASGKRHGVSITGTYHDICPFECDFGIYNNNRVTLHPIRHELATTKRRLSERFHTRLSLYVNPNNFITLLSRLRGYSQSKYFSFDIADFYSRTKISLVAGEGTGAVAIGALESLAAGCIPLLKSSEVQGLDLPPDAYLIYENIEDILNFSEFDTNVEPAFLRNVALRFSFINSTLRFESYIRGQLG